MKRATLSIALLIMVLGGQFILGACSGLIEDTSP